MLKIGDIQLLSRCLLAPMAGITDLPFRMLNRSFGCEFAFLEMVSARSLVFQSKTTLKMLTSSPSDRPLGIQLLGEDPQVLEKAIDIVRPYNFDIIDFNAACPVHKVTSKGEGASLLKDPRKLRDLLEIIVKNTALPVTVKIRSGWDENSGDVRDIALYAQDSGIHGLFIHGRTRAQGYGGRVDYDAIRKVKKALNIPVIGSGDVFSPQLVKKMFDETGCDGVAVARGSLGNPWIFRETSDFLASATETVRPGREQIISTMTRHLDLCTDFHGERKGTMIFRKFFTWYTKGLPGVKKQREKAFHAITKREMTGLISELFTLETPQ